MRYHAKVADGVVSLTIGGGGYVMNSCIKEKKCVIKSLSRMSINTYRESDTRFSTSGFFHESVSPPALEYPIEAILNFYENSQRYLQFSVYRRYKLKFHLQNG